MTRTAPRLAGLLTALLLTACSVPAPSPSLSPSIDPELARRAACAGAVQGVVDAVRLFVEPYNVTEPSATPSTTASPTASPTPGEVDIQSSLEQAQRTIRANKCDEKDFTTDLEQRLAGVTTRGPVAGAVLRRLSAGMTGQIGEQVGVIEVAPGDDLALVISRAPAGATLMLPAGTVKLSEPLVLLDGVIIVGAGRSATVLTTSAADAGIFVLTADLVSINDLTLRRVGKAIGSGIVTGPQAVLSLSSVRVLGARAGKDNQGGAGVQLSAEGSQAAGRGTTLEVTDSIFENNAWTGIAASGGHRVSIVSSRFSNNKQCGICFLDGSEGSVSGSRFERNGIGVAVIGDATPTIANNRITAGDVGIQISGTARPSIDRNTISGSTRAAVIYTDKAAGTLGHTTCQKVRYGIVLGRSSVPTLIDNTCSLVRGGES
ncbi:MAG: right-handed parallel beta-helix repeat-containing protein [Micropruina sp.]